MKMMRILVTGLAAVLGVALYACGGGGGSEAKATTLAILSAVKTTTLRTTPSRCSMLMRRLAISLAAIPNSPAIMLIKPSQTTGFSPPNTGNWKVSRKWASHRRSQPSLVRPKKAAGCCMSEPRSRASVSRNCGPVHGPTAAVEGEVVVGGAEVVVGGAVVGGVVIAAGLMSNALVQAYPTRSVASYALRGGTSFGTPIVWMSSVFAPVVGSTIHRPPSWTRRILRK